MSFGITKPKYLAMIKELEHWHDHRKVFTLLQGVTLCGNFEDWAGNSPWGRFLFLSLRVSVTVVLNKTTGITKDRKIIKLMISEMSQSTSPHDLRYMLLQRTIAKGIYKYEAPAFIDKAMQSEVHIIKEILSQPDKYNLSTPIAHVVSR